MRLTVLMGLISLLACQRVKEPTRILNEKEMVHVLMEIYLAEEKFARAGIPYDSLMKLVPLFRERVMEKTGISDSVFRNSMDYYMARPKELEHIYTALVDSLSLQEQSRSEPTNDAIPK